MTFELLAFRFTFRTVDDLRFPPGLAGNIFRGGFGNQLRRIACRPDCKDAKLCAYRGECAYARLFEPALDSGPSGLADPPRPFVLRPSFNEGQTTSRGALLGLDLHLFDVRTPFIPYLVATFSEMARNGFGPGRGRAALESVDCLDQNRRPSVNLYREGVMVADSLPQPLHIPLNPAEGGPVKRLRIRFLSPTELKTGGRVVSALDFSTLIARLRDRVAALDHLYGSGTVTFDWTHMAESARQVKVVSSSLREEHVERRSSRTGQTHPIGGLTGTVDCEGNVGPFLPLLRAGEWTGVGRQTVWGKGVYELVAAE